MDPIRTISSSKFTPYLLGQIVSAEVDENERNQLINKIIYHRTTHIDFRKWVDTNTALVHKSAVLRSLISQMDGVDCWKKSERNSSTHVVALMRFGAENLKKSFSNLFSTSNISPSESMDALVNIIRTTPPSELGHSLSRHLISFDQDSYKDKVADLVLCINSEMFNHLLVYDSTTLQTILTCLYEARLSLLAQKENELANQVDDGIIKLLCTNRRIRPYNYDSPLEDADIAKAAEPLFYFLAFSEADTDHDKFIELLKLQSGLCRNEGFTQIILSFIPLMSALSELGTEKQQYFVRRILALTNHLEKEYRTKILDGILPLLLELTEKNPLAVYQIITLQDEEGNTFIHLDDTLLKSCDLLICLAKIVPDYFINLFTIKNNRGTGPLTIDSIFKSPILTKLNHVNQELAKKIILELDELLDTYSYYTEVHAPNLIFDLVKKNRDQLLDILSFYPKLFHISFIVKGSKELFEYLIQSTDDKDIDLFFKLLSTQNEKKQCSLHCSQNFETVVPFLVTFTKKVNRIDILNKMIDFLSTQDEEGNTVIQSAFLERRRYNKKHYSFYETTDPIYKLLENLQTKHPRGFVDLILIENKVQLTTYKILDQENVIRKFEKNLIEICPISAIRLMLTTCTELKHTIVVAIADSNCISESIFSILSRKIHSTLKRTDDDFALLNATKAFLLIFKYQDYKNLLFERKGITQTCLVAFANSFSLLKGEEADEIKIEIIDLISELLEYKYSSAEQKSSTHDKINWKLLSRTLMKLACLDPGQNPEQFLKAIQVILSLSGSIGNLALRVLLDFDEVQKQFFITSFSNPHALVDLSLKATDALIEMLLEIKECMWGKRTLMRIHFEKMIPLLSLLGKSENREEEEVCVKLITLKAEGSRPPLYFYDNFKSALPFLIEIAKTKPSLLNAIFQNYNLDRDFGENGSYTLAALPLLEELEKRSFETMFEIFKLNIDWNPFSGTKSQEAYLPWLTEICKKNPKNLLDFLLATSVVNEKDHLKASLPTLKILFLHSPEHFIEFLQHLNLDRSFESLLPLLKDLIKANCDPILIEKIFMSETQDKKTFFETRDNLILLKRLDLPHPQLIIKIMVKAADRYTGLSDESLRYNVYFLGDLLSLFASLPLKDFLMARQILAEHGFYSHNEIISQEAKMYLYTHIDLPNGTNQTTKNPTQAFKACANYYKSALYSNRDWLLPQINHDIINALVEISPFVIEACALKEEMHEALLTLSDFMSSIQKSCLLPYLNAEDGAKVLSSLSHEELPLIIMVATPNQISSYLKTKTEELLSRQKKQEQLSSNQSIPSVVFKTTKIASIQKEKKYIEGWVDAYKSNLVKIAKDPNDYADEIARYDRLLGNYRDLITEIYEALIIGIQQIPVEETILPETVLDPLTGNLMTSPCFILDSDKRPIWWLDISTIRKSNFRNPYTNQHLALIIHAGDGKIIGYAPKTVKITSEELKELERIYQERKDVCDVYAKSTEEGSDIKQDQHSLDVEF